MQTCVPANLTEADLADCVAIVRNGGAIRLIAGRSGLCNARLLAVVRKGQEIAGVGAIKCTRQDYAAQHAVLSGHDFPADRPELGYVARDRGHRGNNLAPRIVAALLSQHKGPLWATTDSERMKQVLSNAGFVRKGNEWQGDRGRLSLWLKD